MKNILITGGAGFIGSNLCKKLLETGNKVICLDNLSTGDFENIKEFEPHPNFTFLDHDVTDEYFLEIDEIYNLACPASPPKYQADPAKTFKTSVLGMLNALELAKKQGARVLQASTSEVYGDPAVHPQNESYWGNVNPVGIRSCYDEGKRAAETVATDYRRQYSTNTAIVRIFNTYGPKMDKNDGRVVSNFINQALLNENITVYGEGLQTRSFCYVDDLVEGLVLMMKSGESGPLNLGNIYEYSVLDFAKKIINLTGSSSKIIHKDLPQDDPKQRKPDISKAKELLCGEPKVSLDEGLMKTIKYFRSKL